MHDKDTPIGTPSEEMLKIEEYLSKKANGEYVTYKELKEELGIDIHTQRDKYYTACRRLGRECINKPGYGYLMSSATNAPTIANNKVDRVIAGTKRVVVAVDNLENMHSSEMTETVKDVLSNTKNVGNAILGKARSAKKIIRKEHPQLSEVNPTI